MSLSVVSVPVQSSSDTVPLVHLVKLLVVAGGGSVPGVCCSSPSHTPEHYPGSAPPSAGVHHVSIPFPSTGIYLTCVMIAGTPSVTTVCWVLLKKYLDDGGQVNMSAGKYLSFLICFHQYW